MVSAEHARTHTQAEYLSAIKRLSTQVETLASGPYHPTMMCALASDLATVCLMYMATLVPAAKPEPDSGKADSGTPAPSTGGPTDTGGPSCP